MNDAFGAKDHPKTQAFLRDLLDLFDKHGLAIVPTYNTLPSLHDAMQVIPLDEHLAEYVRERTLVRIDDTGSVV